MLRYTSALSPQYGEALERLMFFNPGQQAALAAIVDSVEAYGEPQVIADGERLRVKVAKLEEVQALFALDDDTLVGALVYSRVAPERLAVIHLAVDQDYAAQGKLAGQMLVMRLLDLLRNNARRIKGVETIRMMYGHRRFRDIAV